MSNDTANDQTVGLPLIPSGDLVGSRFGHYQILSELGRGGMATVYKADEESLNRVVALKIMSPKISQDPTMIKRFQREAQAAAQLNHPGIVHIYAIGEEQGIHYFTMEYVKGQSLAQLKKARTRIPPAEAANYILQTAEALGEAHRNGMVHRDIKPANIMIDPAGRVRVTDFGIARVASANTQLTVDGSFLGTPQYMSPEQCEGKDIDGRSDLYSLGLTFYELVSGRKPFDAETPGSIIVKIVNGDLLSIRTASPDLPGPVCDVIDKMLQRDPAQRYQSADELAADLRPIAAQHTETEAPTRAYVAPVTAPRPKPRAASVTSAKPPPMPAAPASSTPPAASPAKAEPNVMLIVAGVIVVVALLGTGVCYGLYTLWQRAAAEKRAAATDAEAMSLAHAAATAETTAGAGHEATEAAHTIEAAAVAALPPTAPVETTEPSTPVEAPADAPTGSSAPDVASEEVAASVQAPDEAAAPAPVANASATEPVQPDLSKVAMLSPPPAQRPAPPANSLAISITGDDSRAGLLASSAQSALRSSTYQVVEPLSAGAEISAVAEYLLVIDVSPLGSRSLQYLGRVTEQRSDSITLKLIHTADGRITAGPVSRTVEYTVFNADAKLRDVMLALCDDLQHPAPN
ncbi:MAG: serine/threonine protein kinase [Lentisphaerae bacterium]|nr:serine/threonine protein kinase [Lentisphaerota bacterium]